MSANTDSHGLLRLNASLAHQRKPLSTPHIALPGPFFVWLILSGAIQLYRVF
jgi:hypothetical protein